MSKRFELATHQRVGTHRSKVAQPCQGRHPTACQETDTSPCRTAAVQMQQHQIRAGHKGTGPPVHRRCECTMAQLLQNTD